MLWPGYPILNSLGYSSHLSGGHAPKAGKLGEGKASPNQAGRLVITKLLFLLQEALEQQNRSPHVCSLAAQIRAAFIAGYN